ncbi:hypothetical protein [Acinetobacter sp. HR7]|uniref:hypothetical protein n=1 Tax=Acinetobacter sp. HR7 TaxID=1509403 RepID=UPI0005369C69|nr:hypothetical protein [Acinetobacter sp. HR7]KGT46406.1 hypothetical protein GW12_25650 [Acinetobacter sp. HR7]
MSGGQAKNAALSTALAFHYQVLIGLDKCFSLEENETIWFETDGDISLISPNLENSVQTEVKDYSAPLTDHHENLWKTLKNWLAPEFDHTKYKVLMLHTTQAFGATTFLKDWNDKSGEQRLDILQTIFSKRTEEELNSDSPSEIVKLQKAVMATNEVLLQQVLNKVTLYTEASNAEELEKRILSKPVGIPKNNLKSYLHGLIGFVYGQATQRAWCIKHNEFYAKCEELTAQLCKKGFTFPEFKGYEASPIEIQIHEQKLFVKKITEIEHHEMLAEAIGNWIELQNSLHMELDEYPLYRKKTINYQDQLVKRFKVAYSTAKLEVADPMKGSKKLYNSVILEPPLPIDNSIPPLEYKNGLIHDAMDDENRNLKWKVEP